MLIFAMPNAIAFLISENSVIMQKRVLPLYKDVLLFLKCVVLVN
jgi:hypothetical protein